jgi:hypothetical protein
VQKLVRISVRCVDYMLGLLDRASPAHAVLSRGVIYETLPISRVRVAKIICDLLDAEILLNAAKKYCPEAVPEMEAIVKEFTR